MDVCASVGKDILDKKIYPLDKKIYICWVEPHLIVYAF